MSMFGLFLASIVGWWVFIGTLVLLGIEPPKQASKRPLDKR